ncbi:MAG TPA: amidohydrolase family protein [Bryobacteraceae bacterium]|nr:amidohydrolase family protein [Bryobacteraceae bacterium]
MQRDSPWGPIAVADAHLHFFSHRFFTTLAAQKPGLTTEEIRSKTGVNLPPEEPERFAAMWARELDRHGVERAALIASVPGDEGSVLAAARAFPGRFFAFAMVHPRMWTPENFAGASAACLFPAMHGYSVHDDFAQPVFQWAEQNRSVVFVHCGVLSVGIRGKLGLASPFDMRFSNPVDLHAVALRYPAARFVVPHFGAGYFREALMLADLCPNVYLDTSSSNSWMRYQESHLDLRQVFRRALDVAGPQRLLFGSDSALLPPGWKHQVFDDQATALYELGVSLHDARAIFGENLLRILAR